MQLLCLAELSTSAAADVRAALLRAHRFPHLCMHLTLSYLHDELDVLAAALCVGGGVASVTQSGAERAAAAAATAAAGACLGLVFVLAAPTDASHVVAASFGPSAQTSFECAWLRPLSVYAPLRERLVARLSSSVGDLIFL